MIIKRAAYCTHYRMNQNKMSMSFKVNTKIYKSVMNVSEGGQPETNNLDSYTEQKHFHLEMVGGNSCILHRDN